MALNIKNPEVEKLAAEVAALAGESKTEAIRVALESRAKRLRKTRGGSSEKHRRIQKVLDRARKTLPQELLGKRISKAEREETLGYGPGGY